jgi:acyl-CoA synthetase (NDP forming)
VTLSASLKRLLRPGSIAVAGASPDAASLGGAVLRNIETFGFKGELHLVSPTRAEINGRACLKTLSDLPTGVDAAVLNLPRAAIREAIQLCIERGVGGAVVFAAGFSEAGEEGRREQEEIAALCNAHDFALLGPNCLGLVNYASGAALTFESLEFSEAKGARQVAIVAQSGATAANIRSALTGRGVPVSCVATTGNEAVLRVDHFMREFVEDGAAAIAAYIEQIRDPQAFLAVAREARAKGVPIIMVHPGKSAAGKEAAQSHTGAMAGDYSVMEAMVRHEGVVLVDTMDELFDAAAILYRYPKPASGGVGIITNSGAIRGLSLDFCESVGLPLAALSQAERAKLQATVPPSIPADNPFDIGTAGYSDGAVFTTSTQAMLANPDVGSVLLALTGGGPAQQRAKADAILLAAKDATKPVAVAIIGDESKLDSGLVGAMRESQIPFFRSPDRALRALSALHAYALASDESGASPSTASAPALPRGGAIVEYKGKAFLREIGLRTPGGGLARDAAEAAAIAARVGYPVVLKAQAAALTHKSDIGGVIVGLKDEAALHAGWVKLADNLKRAGAPEIDGVLVEQMVKPGLELVVGGRNDPQWGAVVVFGLGGVWVEALDAIEVMPAHARRAQILRRLRTMKGAKLLGAFRGQAPRDIEAVADAIVSLGAALRAHTELKEVDINPLVVLAAGEGAIALDALLVTDE